jgi:Tfp pilus assembly protein PilF
MQRRPGNTKTWYGGDRATVQWLGLLLASLCLAPGCYLVPTPADSTSVPLPANPGDQLPSAEPTLDPMESASVSIWPLNFRNHGLNNKGVQLFKQGKFQDALHKFQQVVSHDPGNTDGYYNLAATYHRLAMNGNNRQMLTQSEHLYHRCLGMAPNHVDAHRGLAVLLVQSGRKQQAYQLLENWVAESPRSANAQVELARLHDEDGETGQAEVHLQQALSIDTDNARAWTALAHLREREGDLPNALAHYQRSYILDNQQPTVATRIASLNRSLRLDNSGDGTRMVESGTPSRR